VLKDGVPVNFGTREQVLAALMPQADARKAAQA